MTMNELSMFTINTDAHSWHDILVVSYHGLKQRLLANLENVVHDKTV